MDDSQQSISVDNESFSVDSINQSLIKEKKVQPIVTILQTQPIQNPEKPYQNESSVESFSIQSEELNQKMGKKSDKDDSKDFSYDDQKRIQARQKSQHSSSFDMIELKDTIQQFTKMSQKGNSSCEFMNLSDYSNSKVISSDIIKSLNQSHLENSNSISLESSQSSDSSTSQSQISLNNGLINFSKSSFSGEVNQGEIFLNGTKVVNMQAAYAMKKKDEEYEIPYEEGEKIVEEQDQQIYIKKLEKQEEQFKSQEKKEKQRRRKLFITNLLAKIKVEITEQNETKYSRIFLKTQRLVSTTPLIKQDGCIFILDLETNNKKHPIDKNFFKQLKKWPKQLINSMILGPHLTQKMIQIIFQFDWPSLRRVEFHHSVRENVLTKEVQYFVTQNKNNFNFLNNFKYKNNLEFIAVVGNYFTDLMGNSLFTQKFISLKELVIDYDAIISKELFENILSTKPFNLENTLVTIYFNKTQYKQLRKLVNENFDHLSKQISMIRFLERKVQVQCRPYVKEIDDFDSDEDQLKDAKQIIEENQGINKMQKQEIIIEPKNQNWEEMVVEDNQKLTEEETENILQGIENIELEKGSLFPDFETIFYDKNIDPIKLRDRMWYVFGEDFELESMNDLIDLMKDMGFYNKYQKYNEAFKQTKLLQFLYPQITEEYEGEEDETDVFILNFAQDHNYQKPFTLEYLQKIKTWNRFLFTAIAVDYRYQKPCILKQIFSIEWQNVTSLMLENITFRHFVDIRKTNTKKKVKCPQVKLEMLQNFNLNQQLASLTLSGERLPTYLAKDFVEMEFKNLEVLCLFFVKRMKREVIKLLTCARFRNLNPDCHIVIHSFKGKQDKRFYKYLVKYSLSSEKEKDEAYWRERIEFIDYFQYQTDFNEVDYPQRYKSSQEEMPIQEIDKLNDLVEQKNV